MRSKLLLAALGGMLFGLVLFSDTFHANMTKIFGPATHIKRGWDRDPTGQMAPVARPVSLGVPWGAAHPCEVKAASFCSRLVSPATRNHCKHLETWSCLRARYEAD